MHRASYPVVLFLMMLLDAHLASGHPWHVHLVLLFLLFSVPRFSKVYLISIALALGIVFDIYYLGIIGIYAVCFPISVWLLYLLENAVYPNIFTMFFGFIVLVTGFELTVLFLQLGFNLITVRLWVFIARELAPTLFIQIVLFLICSYPLKKLFLSE